MQQGLNMQNEHWMDSMDRLGLPQEEIVTRGCKEHLDTTPIGEGSF